MLIRKVLIAVAVLALAVPGVASAAKPQSAPAEGGFKVTGGGQIIADDQTSGPGDTVGFNAHELEGDDPASPGDNDDLARGQFQYIQRGEDEGGNQPANDSFHGVVTCLISGGEAVANETAEGDDEYDEGLLSGMARFGGHVRGTGTGPGNPAVYFTVDVSDNGEGGSAEDDTILVRMTTAPCADNPEDENNEPDELARLGRGNVQIHNNPDGASTQAALAAFALHAAAAAL